MKKGAIIICAVFLLALCVVPTFAAPAVSPPVSAIGGALSYSDTITMANAVSAQYALLSSSSYMYTTTYYPAFITARDTGGDIWEYKVYILANGVGLSYGGVDGWQVSGANLIISAAGSYFTAPYNFYEGGGIGAWSYAYSSNGGIQLEAGEQICYAFADSSGATIGINRSFPFGSWSTIPACRSWIDALSAYDGALSWERIDQKVKDAYDEGRVDGFNAGKAEAEEYAAEYWGVRVEEAQERGESIGYTDGYNAAVEDMNDGVIGTYTLNIGEIISSVPQAAKAVINNAFGFEIFGINVAGLLSVLLIISIVSFIVAKLSSR